MCCHHQRLRLSPPEKHSSGRLRPVHTLGSVPIKAYKPANVLMSVGVFLQTPNTICLPGGRVAAEAKVERHEIHKAPTQAHKERKGRFTINI
jgi:hypothetical protein